MWIIFSYLIDLDGLAVAKSYYCDGLSIAKTTISLSVAKFWSDGWSVAKDEVCRCITTTTAPTASARVRCYNF
jgi:hypothetical protein